jgi:hypothetical protein
MQVLGHGNSSIVSSRAALLGALWWRRVWSSVRLAASGPRGAARRLDPSNCWPGTQRAEAFLTMAATDNLQRARA